MACPFFDYRNADDEHEFDHDRPFCEVLDEFVLPIRADICKNEREWSHEEHCEIYREHEHLN